MGTNKPFYAVSWHLLILFLISLEQWGCQSSSRWLVLVSASSTSTTIPRPRVLRRPSPGSRTIQKLWNQTKIRGSVGAGGGRRLNSMKFLNRRMPGSGRGGRADEDMRSTVKQLSARSWKFLLDDNLWGTPVIDTSEGKVWKHRLPSDAYGAANSVVKAKGLVAATPEAIQLNHG